MSFICVNTNRTHKKYQKTGCEREYESLHEKENKKV